VGEQEAATSKYEQRLALERQHVARNFYHDLWRALRFVAIYDGYVSESMTVERFMDVLGLLELEVFQRRRMWGPKRAHVQVADPIDLKDHYSAYLADKRGTTKRIALLLESSVLEMLHALESNCQTLRLSN
jgi:hypothetical protein